jgi:hypothetical protein
MLYEMIVSITPFYEPGMEQTALFRRIVKGTYEFPPFANYISSDAIDLISQMLVPNPRSRLGCHARGAKAIKEHDWFARNGITDFAKLGKKGVTAPWKPPIKNPLDTENFQKWKDDAPDDKKDKPLSEQEQLLFKDF